MTEASNPRDLTYGVEITGTWGLWEARVRDLPEVMVRQKEAECTASDEAGRQIVAAVTYYLTHKMPVPTPSPVRRHEHRFVVAINGMRAAIKDAELPDDSVDFLP